MTDFKTIALSDIRPDKNQPRKFFDEPALKELTESIKNKGVLQPIMVRPNGKGYILVCGERRFRASTAAGLMDVPAVIRTLTDEEALEIQFIENIQRDDVHPMDEATTFKSMLESKIKPYTVADIAAKINKPEKFVTHRLSLNNLIPELQTDFWKGKFLIGHAVLFSKLSAEDQKLCAKECKEYLGKDYAPIRDVKNFIDTNVIRVLSAAPFKKDDPTLNPVMGPCTTCPYRSGNNPTLFDEVKETDRCFKPACFNIKLQVHASREIKRIVEEEPEVVFLKSGSYDAKISPELAKLLQDYKIKPLDSYSDFSTHIGKGDIKTKGIWISGNKVGQIEYINLGTNKKVAKHEKTKEGKPTTGAIDEEISGIKARTKRSAELDNEKVYAAVSEVLKNSNKFLSDKRDNRLTTEEITAAIVALHEAGSFEFKRYLKKSLSLDVSEYYRMTVADVNKINSSGLTEFGLNNVIWRFILDKLLLHNGASHTSSGKALSIYNICMHYHPNEVSTAELEQKEKRMKREERAAVRIKALQEQKKAKPVKISPAKKVEAPVKKGKGLKALLK